jgi:hypothetical protein
LSAARKRKASRYKDGREVPGPGVTTTPKAMNEAARKFWADPLNHETHALLSTLPDVAAVGTALVLMERQKRAARKAGGSAPRRSAVELARKVQKMAAAKQSNKTIASVLGITPQHVGRLRRATK